ncbi:MAG: transporter permease, partial [Bryobacterales bacterium]|nr:transporter permease [Bryobacterales bacterium]
RLRQDTGYAIRSMLRNPWFTLTAVLCLALGIGANTAIFTVVHKVLLARLPYPDSERLVVVGRIGNKSTESPMRYSYWKQNDHGLEGFSAFQPGSSNLAGSDAAELVKTIAASSGYFALFSARTAQGRTFNDSEDRPGGNRVAVLSHSLWQRRFGGNVALLGRSLVLGDESYTVIGVLSPEFVSYPAADIWVPLQAEPASTNAASTLTVAGRLPQGTSLAMANTRMRAMAARFAANHTSYLAGSDKIQVAYLKDQLAADVRPLLFLLLGSVGVVLLVACANVANLLLARAASRQREIAIRAAIGALPRAIDPAVDYREPHARPCWRICRTLHRQVGIVGAVGSNPNQLTKRPRDCRYTGTRSMDLRIRNPAIGRDWHTLRTSSRDSNGVDASEQSAERCSSGIQWRAPPRPDPPVNRDQRSCHGLGPIVSLAAPGSEFCGHAQPQDRFRLEQCNRYGGFSFWQAVPEVYRS